MASRRSPDSPLECSFPLSAQIPLQSFVFPIFPPQASRLRELTLVCDIKLDDYQEILSKHSLEEQREKQLAPNTHARRSSYNASKSLVFHAPNLPPSITSVELELFSHGFPAGWLRSLARSLPKLKSLTFSGCLIDGLDNGSRNDAIDMLEMLKLRNLYVIDSFTKPGFWREAAIGLSEEHERAKEAYTEHEDGHRRHAAKGLQVLEMSYTYRGHSDSDFMSKIAGEELPNLLGSGVVAASFNLLAPPEPIPQESGQENSLVEDAASLDENGQMIDHTRPEGVLPFSEYGRASSALRKRFEYLSSGKDLCKLRMLNISLWTLRPEEVEHVLYSCAGGGSGVLEDLCISVLMRPGWWDELLKSLTDRSQALEGLEIVGVPDLGEKGDVNLKAAEDLFGLAKDIEKLGLACPRLVRFEMTILLAKSYGRVSWKFDVPSGRWNGGFVPGKGRNGHQVLFNRKEAYHRCSEATAVNQSYIDGGKKNMTENMDSPMVPHTASKEEEGRGKKNITKTMDSPVTPYTASEEVGEEKNMTENVDSPRTPFTASEEEARGEKKNMTEIMDSPMALSTAGEEEAGGEKKDTTDIMDSPLALSAAGEEEAGREKKDTTDIMDSPLALSTAGEEEAGGEKKDVTENMDSPRAPFTASEEEARGEKKDMTENMDSLIAPYTANEEAWEMVVVEASRGRPRSPPLQSRLSRSARS